MQRYKLTIAYDGTDYAGWQVQPNGMTVQERLENSIHKLTGGEKVKVHGSGRTDQGVHARQQVAHFDLNKTISCKTLRRGLNALLPADVRILKAQRANPTFHARRSAVSKEYRYFIWNGDIIPPFLRHYRTHIRTPLDIVGMRKACSLLMGRHDFTAFSANSKKEIESAVRNLSELRILKRGSEIVIIAKSEGFLYKMVRSLAGFLIKVGEGAKPPTDAKIILSSRKRTARVPTAPPQGLFLWNVIY
ncbi:tRNA pseudouridine(38-40) synthase TruA [Verrucomicrobiota bacterium]